MLNQCSFIGNLGRDPETRTFSNGNKVCNLSLACSERWKTREGEQREHTEWVSIAVFSDGLIRVCEQYLRKGSKVFVQGKMKTRKYQDQSGQDRYTTEVVLQGPQSQMVMLDGPQDRQQGGASGGYQEPDGYGAGGRPGADMDDEIPFAPEWRA